jgi:hypothetical protein
LIIGFSSGLFASQVSWSGSEANEGESPIEMIAIQPGTAMQSRFGLKALSSNIPGWQSRYRAGGASMSTRAEPPVPVSVTRVDVGKPGMNAGFRQTNAPEILVQGGTLKTWQYQSPAVERVQVTLKTDGRPMDADIELWAGPDNTPHKMRVYNQKGEYRPFTTVLETPRGPNTVAVRNIAQMEFPLRSLVAAVPADGPLNAFNAKPVVCQGGALKTFPFSTDVDSVEVMLRTDGRPLNARIELLQGPNSIKQLIELYTDDGVDRPFYGIVLTPGSGNVLRIINTSPMEFPMTIHVGPLATSPKDMAEDMMPVIK